MIVHFPARLRGVCLATLALVCCAGIADARDPLARTIYLQDQTGLRIEIGVLTGTERTFSVVMNDDAFTDQFLSMRPFKCLEGPEKMWCHVPYPYENKRDLTSDMTDLEYDLLFVWKGRGAYGIDMWNGVYYRIQAQGDGLHGVMHDVNLDVLAVPPDAGDLRPIGPADLTAADPDSNWLPHLVIE